jgi:hypothetical protein
MKTLNELRAFCEGYRKALNFTNLEIAFVDDWVKWGGYDINLFGSYYSVRLEDNVFSLSVDAYPVDWHDVLPDPIHSFDIYVVPQGESK